MIGPSAWRIASRTHALFSGPTGSVTSFNTRGFVALYAIRLTTVIEPQPSRLEAKHPLIVNRTRYDSMLRWFGPDTHKLLNYRYKYLSYTSESDPAPSLKPSRIHSRRKNHFVLVARQRLEPRHHRYSMGMDTLNMSATSRTGVPDARSRSAALIFSPVIFWGRPPTRPRDLAAFKPAVVRSRIRSRSNSLIAAITWNINRPLAWWC